MVDLNTSSEPEIMAHLSKIGDFDEQAKAFRILAGRGFLEACRNLLTRGVAIDRCDESGNNALHLAAAAGHEKICRLICDSDFYATSEKSDARNAAGDTALNLSLMGRHIKTAEFLRSRCNQGIVGSNGKTAEQMFAEIPAPTPAPVAMAKKLDRSESDEEDIGLSGTSCILM